MCGRGVRVQARGNACHVVVVLVLGPQAAARGQQRAQVVRQPLVAPQQVCLHRLLIIRSSQVSRTAELPIPRVHKLMREQAAYHVAGSRPKQNPLRQTAVVGLVMLESKVRHVIAQGQQKMVIPIMARSK